jgi:hypothetical protein
MPSFVHAGPILSNWPGAIKPNSSSGGIALLFAEVQHRALNRAIAELTLMHFTHRSDDYVRLRVFHFQRTRA